MTNYVNRGTEATYGDEKVDLFPFLPNYRRDFIERWEWKTDVLISHDGTEQRIRLRQYPRRTLEYEVFARDMDRAALENYMYRYPTKMIAVPDWNYGIRFRETMKTPYSDHPDSAEIRHGIICLGNVGGVFQVGLGNKAPLPYPPPITQSQLSPELLSRRLNSVLVGGLPVLVPPEILALEVATATLNSEDSMRLGVLNLASVAGAFQAIQDDPDRTPDVITVGDTSLTPFVPGSLIVIFSSPSVFEIHRIKKLFSNSLVTEDAVQSAGGMLYPLVLGRMNLNQSFIRQTADLTTGVMTLNTNITATNYFKESFDYPTYEGRYVLEETFNWDGGRPVEFEYKAKILDIQTNPTSGYVESDEPAVIQNVKWFLNSPEKISSFLRFIHYASGRAKSFWLPTFTADIVPRNIEGTVLYAEDTGYAEYVYNKEARKHIRIQLKSGYVYYRQIFGYINDQGGGERFILNNPLPVNTDRIKMVSFMNVARFDQDRVELAYKGPGFATADTRIRTIRKV